MPEYVLLDAGSLGRACRRRGSPSGDQCRLWLDGLRARGVDIVVPEIADFEVRPERTRVRATGSLRRLDGFVTIGELTYAPVTTLEWRQAAILWADARRQGLPTASPDALEADVVLAACAATIGPPGVQIIVATLNVGHLARYCDARFWLTIT